MSKYLELRARELYPRLAARVDEILAGDFGLSSVATYEVRRGLEHLQLCGRKKQLVARTEMFLRGATIYPMDDSPWRSASRIYALGKTRGVSFHELDLLILATAIAHNARLVTTDAPLAAHAAEVGEADSVELLPLA